jgi:uncharacterized protein (DUF433 family)
MSSDVIQIDPDILGGTPCFAGTRVPVKSLYDHLKLGYSIDEFLQDFPTVERWQIQLLLDELGNDLLSPNTRAAG